MSTSMFEGRCNRAVTFKHLHMASAAELFISRCLHPSFNYLSAQRHCELISTFPLVCMKIPEPSHYAYMMCIAVLAMSVHHRRTSSFS
jgi:hypothetical protein